MSPLEDALSLAGEGLRVFACEPRGKRPLAAAAPHGCHSATTDLAVIQDIWSRYPTANVGVATGDGILVLDVDGDEGVLTLTELGPLPRTRSVRTGTGYHFYFRAEGVDLKNTARKLGAGLDTRGTGGYVIASGTHPSGAEYQGDDLPIADAPPWLVAALLAPDRKRDTVAAVVRIGDTTPYGQRALEDETRRVESAPEGEGNDTLNRAAFALGQLEAGGEIAYGESQRALEDAAASWEHPDRGSTATIRSGLQGGRGDPRSAPPRLEVVSTTTGADAKVDETIDRFSLESWGDFRDHTSEDIDYLVGGLIPQGSLVFLASQPKAGKTWLALSLAVSVATGKRYLERFDIDEPSSVLYLALEGHRTDYRTRLGAISRGHGVDPDSDALASLTISYQPVGLDLMDPSWATSLKKAVEQTGARIVFVDVLRNSAPRLREDGQGSSDFAIIRTHLQPLLKAGVTVVLVHHFTKTGNAPSKRSIGEMMSGSGSLFGAADLIIGITTPPKDWENLKVEFIGRSAPAPDPFRVQIVGDKTGKYGGFRYADALSLSTLLQDQEPTVRVWHHAEKMAKWIQTQGRRVSAVELEREFRVSKNTIRDHDHDLFAAGISHVIDPDNNRNSGYEETKW